MPIINYTTLELTILVEGKDAIVLPPSGRLLRLPAPRVLVGEVDGVPLYKVALDARSLGLPDPVEGVTLIVAAVAARANPERRDLVSPGELVRDRRGRLIGCRGLCACWRAT